MAQRIKDYNDSFNERLKRLPEALRLAIIVSIFWPVFTFIYVIDPEKLFIASEFIRKFALMGILPLLIAWGTFWVLRGVKR